MASEPLTLEREKEIREWLSLQDSLYAEGGVWHGRKREDHHIRAAAMVDEIDRLREELAIVEQENKEARAGAERECNRYRAALIRIRDETSENDSPSFEIARAALEGKP